MSLASFYFCRMCTKSDRKRDAGLEIPKEVRYVRSLRYGENKKYHILDICWPKQWDEKAVDPGKDKLPVIISVHGGGYVYGSKEVYQFYAANLAEKGFAVINYNYRLAPKYKFPAPLQDLSLVIDWILAHQEEYPLDPDRVFIVGDSAGAQIASQYGAIYSNPEYEKIMGIAKPPITLRALGLCCGTYDLKKGINEAKGRGLLREYLTGNPFQFGKMLDVLEHITGEYPPVYMFSSHGDFLVEECGIMAEFLNGKGVLCRHKIYGTEQTGHVFHVDMNDAFGAEANEEQVAFFREVLNGKEKR